jgi:hypothetical protein
MMSTGMEEQGARARSGPLAIKPFKYSYHQYNEGGQGARARSEPLAIKPFKYSYHQYNEGGQGTRARSGPQPSV